VARVLEYPEQALEEAEAAARWYAERSRRAALAFSEEIDAAETAISRLPDAIRNSIAALGDICFADFRSVSFTARASIPADLNQEPTAWRDRGS
jgi:hypothetical protein